MIQRIQSIYLALTTLLSFLFLKGAFLKFIEQSGNALYVAFNGLVRETGVHQYELVERLILLTIFIILIPVFSSVSIFLFKKRNLQLRAVSVLIILNVILVLLTGFYSYYIISKFHAIFSPNIKIAIPVLQLIFSSLAYRAIKKDDLLVKSYDRLR
jgi:hypothetical protein